MERAAARSTDSEALFADLPKSQERRRIRTTCLFCTIFPNEKAVAISHRVNSNLHAIYQVCYYPPCCTDSVRRRYGRHVATYMAPQAAQLPVA